MAGDAMWVLFRKGGGLAVMVGPYILDGNHQMLDLFLERTPTYDVSGRKSIDADGLYIPREKQPRAESFGAGCCLGKLLLLCLKIRG